MNELENTYAKLAAKEAARRVKRKERRAAKMGQKKNRPLKSVPSRLETLERYLSHTKPNLNGCLEWQCYRNKWGYGMLKFGNEGLCHRILWILMIGEIPPGMLVCHTCDNPACVNIAHLFLGTNLDNMRDCARKGHLKARKVHRKILTAAAYREIRKIYAPLKAQRRRIDPKTMTHLSKKYGIAKGTITCIGCGSNFREASFDPIR